MQRLFDIAFASPIHPCNHTRSRSPQVRLGLLQTPTLKALFKVLLNLCTKSLIYGNNNTEHDIRSSYSAVHQGSGVPGLMDGPYHG